MGDLLGSPRVAPLLFAALVETALLHPFFLFFPRLQHSSRAPSLRVSRRYDTIGGAHLSRLPARARACKIVAPPRKRLIFFRNDANVQSAKCFHPRTCGFIPNK